MFREELSVETPAEFVFHSIYRDLIVISVAEAAIEEHVHYLDSAIARANSRYTSEVWPVAAQQMAESEESCRGHALRQAEIERRLKQL